MHNVVNFLAQYENIWPAHIPSKDAAIKDLARKIEPDQDRRMLSNQEAIHLGRWISETIAKPE